MSWALATVAHLSRYRGTSRQHTESDLTESDLRVFVEWCRERRLSPLGARRHDLELCLQWLQAGYVAFD